MGSIPFHEHRDETTWAGRRSFIDLVPYGVVLAEPDGAAMWANRTWTQLTGQTERDWRGHGWLDVCAGTDRDVHWNDLVAAARSGASHRTDWIISADGRGHRTLHVHAVPDTDGGRLHQIVVTATDVTEDRARSARLLDLASHDSLTGLLNRAQFLEFVGHALDRRRRAAGKVTAVLFVDVDDLKAVNDGFGHAEGDRVLCEVAARIKAGVRPADVVARYGGDEFTVLCEDLDDASDADAIAARIRSSALHEPRHDVTIGIAIAREPDTDPASIVAEADRAMYQRKGARSARRVGGGPLTSRTLIDWTREAVLPAPELVVAAKEVQEPLTTIEEAATALRDGCRYMNSGDVDLALTDIERATRQLALILDRIKHARRCADDQPPMV